MKSLSFVCNGPLKIILSQYSKVKVCWSLMSCPDGKSKLHNFHNNTPVYNMESEIERIKREKGAVGCQAEGFTCGVFFLCVSPFHIFCWTFQCYYLAFFKAFLLINITFLAPVYSLTRFNNPLLAFKCKPTSTASIWLIGAFFFTR